MQGIRALARMRSHSAVSTQIVVVGVVAIVIIAGIAGYLVLLRPGSSTSSSQTIPQGGVASGVGSTQGNPASAIALYLDYNLGGNATDYPRFTSHTIYARGNITSIVNFPKTNQVETQLATGGDSFEYWDWQNGTVLPAFANNQLVLAHCYVRGLVPSQNGTAYLYLNDCNLISILG